MRRPPGGAPLFKGDFALFWDCLLSWCLVLNADDEQFVSPNSPEVPVANIKSQIKRNRQNEKARIANKAVRSELKTRTKAAVSAAERGAENGEEALRLAIKRLDKAASSGVIHKNQAANRKSRLMRRINALSASE
jgi:small subunit ribosomal protein S20